MEKNPYIDLILRRLTCSGKNILAEKPEKFISKVKPHGRGKEFKKEFRKLINAGWVNKRTSHNIIYYQVNPKYLGKILKYMGLK
ncbi:hypothetical protein HOC11_08985 [archaeon]|jgi:hypothetical protein|nr:hypothetical protein [archaeon]